jgi:hydroxyacylglutathione hydrolase
MRKVFPVPAFDDNYLWVIDDGRSAAVIDPGAAAPVVSYLVANGLRLRAVLVTHHHGDHIGGIAELLDWCGDASVAVFGPAHENIPHRTRALVEGDQIEIAEPAISFAVIDVPGHTSGHIAYYSREAGWLFCGDTLFAGGCGRLFEGTAAQMQASLAKLAALPDTTQFFCAHEYTLANLRFAVAAEPNNTALAQRVISETAKRSRGEPTLPSTIGLERATNPFLRWDSAEIKLAAQRASSDTIGPNAPPALVFGAIREWKNRF